MKIAELENLLGYKFANPALLERAVTHRSWAHENLPGETEEKIREYENESLEFVGDSVLGLVIAEQLYTKHPSLTEGDLTLMKHSLVSTTTLFKIAKSLNLGNYVRIGRGEEKTGGRKKQAILADTLEAIIAAVFFDGGYGAASSFICSLFSGEMESVTPTSSLDYKTLLQETLQAERLSAPVYSIVKTEGLPHARTFFVEAAWNTGRSQGTGGSIKSAEMMAASEALKTLQLQNRNTSKRND
ncbi:MAG: ribonuclease III [Pyrinomonadaceae bacterium]|nr:ribonuclease III [Blastocatellia bacterium]MDQ3221566.1 ribonuclease III [Acidobacteriota bacterium]MDQ3490423.1 ribonuclease III [Acidobacteriota bacterium]